MTQPKRSGFTLIELLVVVVIIGILTSIAIPKFKNTRGKAYVASMKTDLRNLATAQEGYYYNHSVYTTDTATLQFVRSQGVSVEITEASAKGWAAISFHAQADPLRCGIYFGEVDAKPSQTDREGVVNCR